LSVQVFDPMTKGVTVKSEVEAVELNNKGRVLATQRALID